jgi:hypothetical protein
MLPPTLMLQLIALTVMRGRRVVQRRSRQNQDTMTLVYQEHALKLLVVRDCVMLPLQGKVVANMQALGAEPLQGRSLRPVACCLFQCLVAG